MKYCKNCGNAIADDESFCRICGTKQDDPFYSSTVASPYYDDVKPVTLLSKTMQIIIKILLIVAIATVFIDAGRVLVGGLSITQADMQAYVDQMIAQDPSVVEVFEVIDIAQFAEIVKTMVIFVAVCCLIPLCWRLPMSKNILKAMKNGTTLSTGFKVCTLIFVNVILGIVLLCQRDI